MKALIGLNGCNNCRVNTDLNKCMQGVCDMVYNYVGAEGGLWHVETDYTLRQQCSSLAQLPCLLLSIQCLNSLSFNPEGRTSCSKGARFPAVV